MIRLKYRPHAYCVGAVVDGEKAELCTFNSHGTLFTGPLAVRAAAERHVMQTGHEVWVDVVDRTEYTPQHDPAVTQ